MKLLIPRPLLVLLAVGTAAGAAVLAQQLRPAGAEMTAAAAAFLAGLSADQKAKALFRFDDAERGRWFFTPQQTKDKKPLRKGLRLDELDAGQRDSAMALLRTGLSGKGYDQASTIMSLETILADLEGATGANTRNPRWYFVSVFGEPSNTGPWGWRVEGHHCSVSVSLDRGEVVLAAPVVFGSNPAEVRAGPRKGLRPLGDVEDAAAELVRTLSDDQKAVARQPKQFPEIQEGKPSAGVGAPVGLSAGKMTPPQKAVLSKLIGAYAGRLPADVAAGELRRIDDAGRDAVHFAYAAEETKPGNPHTYRVQGPTFVIEFLNLQADSAGNPANHIHSGWRRLPADFPTR